MHRGGLLRSAVTIVSAIAGSTILSWLLVALIGTVRHGIFWRAHPVWTHLTIYAATILAGVALLATIGSGLDRTKLRPGFWLIFLIVGGAIGLIAPGGTVFFIFPPLLALIGRLAARGWQPAERVGSYAAIMFLYLTWGATIGLLEELLNGGPMWIFAPLGSLLILPVLIEARPLIVGAGPRAPAMVAGALTLIGVGAVLAVPAYSADRQQRFVIQHVTDASARKSWWSVLDDAAPLPRGFAGQWKRGELSFSDGSRWLSEAPSDPARKAPNVQLISETKAGNERTLALRLAVNGNDRVKLIAPADALIRSAGVSGFVRPINQNEEGKYFIECFGRSCDGLTLQLTIGQLKPIQFLVLGSKAPLPPSAAPLIAARPRFARPQYNRDESIVFTGVNL